MDSWNLGLARSAGLDLRAVSVLLPAMQDHENPAPEEELPDEVEVVEEEEAAPEAPVELSVEEEMLKWRETAARAAADLDNYRKRMARERAADMKYSRASLIEELLPVFDNFSMGLQMAEAEQDSMIYKGMAMVKGQLDDFLEGQGVKEVVAEGEFDPNLHDAISEAESVDVEPGVILEVRRKGYQLHDRLLRPAAVVVAKAPEGAAEGDASAEELAETEDASA